jgi:hypothetical protein
MALKNPKAYFQRGLYRQFCETIAYFFKDYKFSFDEGPKDDP